MPLAAQPGRGHLASPATSVLPPHRPSGPQRLGAAALPGLQESPLGLHSWSGWISAWIRP
jgi:hypothetical protein